MVTFGRQSILDESLALKMYKITFKLRKAATNKKTGEAPVSLVYRFEDSEFVKATGISCKPQYFNAAAGQVKSSDPLAAEKNARIASLTHKIELVARRVLRDEHTYDAARVSHWVTELKTLEANVDAAMPEIHEQIATDIVGVRQRIAKLEQELEEERFLLRSLLFLNEGEEEIPADPFTTRILEFLARRGALLKPETQRNYQSLARLVKAYDLGLDITRVNLATLNGFQTWLVEKKQFKNQSVNNYVTKFKAVLKEFADELNMNLAYFQKFKPLPDLANENIIILAPEEIREIEALDLSRWKVMSEVRDQFMFCHETGLRHSDLGKVRLGAVEDMPPGDGQLVGRKQLRIATQKGKKQIIVPLTQKALDILTHNDFSFHTYKLRNYNQALESIARRCPTLSHEFTRTHYSGTREIQESKPKCEFVQSHAGRRTFINNALLRGASESTVATWVGHTDVKMIQQHYSHREMQAQAEAHKILR